MKIKSVVIHHNYEKEYHVDSKTIESFWGMFPYYVIRNERNAYLGSSMNLFLTMEDREKFEKEYGCSKSINRVIGCFEPADSVKACLQHPRRNKFPRLVISGTMNSYQTIDGINKFTKRYWQIVKKILKDSRLTVTGRNPDQSIIEGIGKDPMVDIVPNPQEIMDVVSKADIYICPTCIGGGLKLRLMDGLRCGLMILVHRVSARGYGQLRAYPWFQEFDDEISFEEGVVALQSQFKTYSPDKIIDAYNSIFSFESGLKRFQLYLDELFNNVPLNE